NPNDFKNGRHFAAWLGLVPRQFSSGGKTKLGRISKRGDKYIRKLLIHGARSAISRSKNKFDSKSIWALRKVKEIGYNKACVALANKHARIIWNLIAKDEPYCVQ
ncbi:transposase, partial [Thiotrichales bacterium 19X7-9]|nr:transposase [Thiotrichales bacterium 19X7-9]